MILNTKILGHPLAGVSVHHLCEDFLKRVKETQKETPILPPVEDVSTLSSILQDIPGLKGREPILITGSNLFIFGKDDGRHLRTLTERLATQVSKDAYLSRHVVLIGSSAHGGENAVAGENWDNEIQETFYSLACQAGSIPMIKLIFSDGPQMKGTAFGTQLCQYKKLVEVKIQLPLGIKEEHGSSMRKAALPQVAICLGGGARARELLGSRGPNGLWTSRLKNHAFPVPLSGGMHHDELVSGSLKTWIPQGADGSSWEALKERKEGDLEGEGLDTYIDQAVAVLSDIVMDATNSKARDQGSTLVDCGTWFDSYCGGTEEVKSNEKYEETTTFDESARVFELDEALIRPITAHIRCPRRRDGTLGSAYVDSILGRDRVGLATHMLSYSWSYSIGDITSSLSLYCDENDLNPKRVYVWICFLCVNQHDVQMQRKKGLNVSFDDFRKQFGTTVRGVKNVLALASSWEDPAYFNRLWCIYEAFTALSNDDCKFNVILPPREEQRLLTTLKDGGRGIDPVFAAIAKINVETAQATMPEDRKAILAILETSDLGYDGINSLVKMKLKNWYAKTSERYVREILLNSNNKEEVTKAGLACSVVSNLLREMGHEQLVPKSILNSGFAALEAHGCIKTKEYNELMRSRGMAERRCGNFSAALSSYRQISAFHVENYSLETHGRTMAVMNVGACLIELGENMAALEELEKAWELHVKRGTVETGPAGIVKKYISVALVQMNDLVGARKAALQAKNIHEKVKNLEHPISVQVLDILGSIYLKTEDIDSAIVELERAKQIRTKLAAIPTVPNIVALIGIAVAKMRANYPDHEASQTLQTAKEISENNHFDPGSGSTTGIGSILIDAILLALGKSQSSTPLVEWAEKELTCLRG